MWLSNLGFLFNLLRLEVLQSSSVELPPRPWAVTNYKLLPSEQVILSLFAGEDTTAISIARILQLLATADEGKEIVASLLQEQRNEATSDDDQLDETAGTGKGGASREGILGAFPLLDAVILEAAR